MTRYLLTAPCVPLLCLALCLFVVPGAVMLIWLACINRESVAARVLTRDELRRWRFENGLPVR